MKDPDRCAHELHRLQGNVFECQSCEAQFRISDETQPLVQATIKPNPKWTIGEVLTVEVQTDDLQGGYRLRVLTRRPRRDRSSWEPWWRRWFR